MRAAVFYGPNDLRLEERPRPVPAENELLLRVGACAICGSDLRTIRYGAGNITGTVIIGHEVAGVIEEAGGNLDGWQPGTRVAVAPAVPCCECRYCLRGIQTMCDNLRSIGYQYDGGFAEYMIVPWAAVKAGCVNPLPESLSLEEATLAEPLACAINGQELLRVAADDTVLIVGAGPLGCMHADLARIAGARKIILADVRESRLRLARGFPADVFLNAAREDFAAEVLRETDGAGADVVIVAAPSAQAQEQALTLAAKHGRVSFFGGLPKSSPTATINANLVHYRELFIMGAYGSMPRHNRQALDLLSQGAIHASGLIGAAVPLTGIQSGLDAVASGDVLKVIVRPGE